MFLHKRRFFSVDGIDTVHKKNRAECFERFGPVLVPGRSAGVCHLAARLGGGRLSPFCFCVLTASFLVVDGHETVYKINRAERYGCYRHQPLRWTYMNSNVIGEILSSAWDFHRSYTYTRALGDSSSCTCWRFILYDLYLFVLDLCISW